MTSHFVNLDDLVECSPAYIPHMSREAIPLDHPVYDTETLHAQAKTAQDILKRNGMGDIEITDEDAFAAEAMFNKHAQHLPINPSQLQKPETVLKLEALITAYDWKVVQHNDQIRYLVTNKLIEMTDHKDARIAIKAVELLGKLADVGMFVEKQEITFKQQSSEDLEAKLRAKLGLIIEGELVGETIVPPQDLAKLDAGIALQLRPDMQKPPVPKIDQATIRAMMTS